MRQLAVILGVALLTVAVEPAMAGPTELVLNGSFENSTYTTNNEFGSSVGNVTKSGVSQGITGWTGNGGYDLYFLAGTQSTQNAVSRYGGTRELLWPSVNALSPSGGNFVALDGDTTIQGGLSQTVGGFVPGQRYLLSFYWAGGQLQSAQGITTDSLIVSAGSDLAVTTPIVTNASEGFVPWMQQRYGFTATATTELLTFLSAGTPNGAPPMALLDGVSIIQVVPEPATFAVVVAGLAVAGLLRRRSSNVGRRRST